MFCGYWSAICASLLLIITGAPRISAAQLPLTSPHSNSLNRTVSSTLFYELEELARIVDISYCVGTTGIQKPFLCVSRCQEFPDFELITVSAICNCPCGTTAKP